MREEKRHLLLFKILILAAVPLLVLPLFFAQGQTSCTDSDGGLDYSVKGFARKGRAHLEDYCGLDNVLN
jgi:hypothetical protein